jgi:uncharacterized protein involved in exopolysaccharide biosynthesis
MIRPPEPGLSPSWLCRLAWRHKGKMALFSLAVLGAAVAVTLLSPKTYRSQAKLLVRLGRENTTLDATATLGQAPVVAVPSTREAELNSVLEVLTSRFLLEKVVDSVGPEAVLGQGPVAPPAEKTSVPEPEPEPSGVLDDRYKAVKKLQKAIKVEAVRKSNVVVLTCDGPSPEVARAIVARLVDFYLDRHMTLNRPQGADKFLAEQADAASARLARTEEELHALKDKTGLVSPDAQRQVRVTRIGRLEDELLQATAAAEALQAEVKFLERQADSLPKTQVTATTKGMPNQAADLMRGQLYALQLKEKELLARHREEHPEVKLVRRQVAAARAVLAREERAREQTTTGPNKLYEEALLALARQQTQLAALEARAGALRRQLARVREGLKAFNADELRLARLQRKLDLEVAHHRRYKENAEQGRIDRALQLGRISNISLAQPATYEVKPVRPRLSVNLGLALLVAVSGSFGLAVLSEQRRSATSPPPGPGSLRADPAPNGPA